MSDRFEFEQEFLNCWTITNDLALLVRECEEIEDAEVADHIQNLVLGLSAVYEARFHKAWETFEEIIKDG